MEAFGRLPDPDSRDHGYLLAPRLEPGLILPTRKTWAINPRALNQGPTGTCVGHGWRNFLRAAPIKTEKSGPSPFDIYRQAVLQDSWPENDDEAGLADGDSGMDFGTSVRAGAKALAAVGRLQTYLWAFTLQPVVEWVLTKGPVVMGTEWFSSMSFPDPNGLATIQAGSQVIGGHCYLVRGMDTKRALARCSNSWGDSWGVSGDFWVGFKDLERLILDGGECCTAVEKPV